VSNVNCQARRLQRVDGKTARRNIRVPMIEVLRTRAAIIDPRLALLATAAGRCGWFARLDAICALREPAFGRALREYVDFDPSRQNSAALMNGPIIRR